MEDRQLEARESFELIARMIDNTRNRMERNAGRPFLVWGYTTLLFTALITAMAIYFQDPRWNWLWFGLPMVGGALMWLSRRKNTQGMAYTFVDRVVAHIWMVLGLAAWFTASLSMLTIIRPPMLFVIVLLMGIGTTLTGLVIRFTPASVGGMIGIVLAPTLLCVPGMWQPALFAAAFVAMMIVPGHVLNYRSNHPKTH